MILVEVPIRSAFSQHQKHCILAQTRESASQSFLCGSAFPEKDTDIDKQQHDWLQHAERCRAKSLRSEYLADDIESRSGLVDSEQLISALLMRKITSVSSVILFRVTWLQNPLLQCRFALAIQQLTLSTVSGRDMAATLL